jgi:oligopeptidase B
MRWRQVVVAALLAACASIHPAPPATASLQPPVARKEPHVRNIHGDSFVDNYFWLRNKGTPEVEQYLRAESAYADEAMKPTAALQEKLYQEMVSRVQEDDSTVPYQKGHYWYYGRTDKGKQYPTVCRKASLDGPEQILLDINAMSEGKKYLAVGGWSVSDDDNQLVYVTDETGFRQYELHVRDLRTGVEGPEHIARVDSISWSSDSSILYYVVEDPQEKRPYQLWRHRLNTTGDTLIYEEKDQAFDLEIGRSRSKQYIFVTSSSHTTSEIRFFDAGEETPHLVLIEPRQQGREYYADHRGGDLWIRTNDTGRNFRLVTAPVASPGRDHWKEVIPEREGVMLSDVDLFRDFVVLDEREGGLPQITFLDPTTFQRRRVTFPEADFEVSAADNPEFDQAAYRVTYESLVTPETWIDINAATLQQTVLKKQPVPNYDASRYEVERQIAPASDGTRIPIAVVHRKGLVRDGKSPLYLYGYGAYGWSLSDQFDADRTSLLDRGVSCAIAHVRGGGELGKRWHDEGRMLKKMNTFTDFIASAEYLVAEKYTSPDRLAIGGASAGGLLMGAVTNLRPDLFRVVLAWVPFVDVINTMLDESLPLTVPEFEEWGNPKKPDEYAYIMRYSPYDNIAARQYPAILVRSAYNDSQVMYWEPSKYVARLRALKKDTHPLLFKIDMEPAGHSGTSGRYDRLRDIAFDDAFMLTQFGITQ